MISVLEDFGGARPRFFPNIVQLFELNILKVLTPASSVENMRQLVIPLILGPNTIQMVRRRAFGPPTRNKINTISKKCLGM